MAKGVSDKAGAALSLKSSPATGGERATVASTKNSGFFGRKPKVSSTDETSWKVNGKGAAFIVEEPPVQPASFTSLFRFTTKFELFLNFIGLICAIAAGAAQVCFLYLILIIY
jgi:ATP-binding cassette, subfamily B (MDR/TAP), member 1